MLRSSRGNKNQSAGVAKEGRAIVNNPAQLELVEGNTLQVGKTRDREAAQPESAQPVFNEGD